MNKTKITMVFLSLFISAVFLILGNTSHAQSVFFDGFDGEGLDETKWGVKLKGGSYKVADGALSLYSSEYFSTGNGFPAITSRYNPFPEDRDWTLNTMMGYITGYNTYGDGMALYEGSSKSKIAYVYQDRNKGEFYLWDSRENMSKRIWNGDTLSDTHIFTIQREGDYYLGYVDGKFAGSAYNESDPGRLVLGNDDVGPLYGYWNPVSIGYVDISIKDPEPAPPALTDPVSIPEPETLFLSISGIIAILFKLHLNFRHRNVVH